MASRAVSPAPESPPSPEIFDVATPTTTVQMDAPHAAVGVPNPDLGEEVKAIVQPVAGVEGDGLDLPGALDGEVAAAVGVLVGAAADGRHHIR